MTIRTQGFSKAVNGHSFVVAPVQEDGTRHIRYDGADFTMHPDGTADVKATRLGIGRDRGITGRTIDDVVGRFYLAGSPKAQALAAALRQAAPVVAKKYEIAA